VQWQENWYPVHGIGNLVYASQRVALNMARTSTGLRVALYPTVDLRGTLTVLRAEDGQTVAELPLDVAATVPFVQSLESIAADAAVIVRVRDQDGALLLEYVANN